MKYEIVPVVLLVIAGFGLQPVAARMMPESLAGVSTENVTATPENLRNGIFLGATAQAGDDVLDDNGQSLKAVKFETRHAPEVQFMNDVHDQIMGSIEANDDAQPVALQHHPLAYFSQPDARSILALIFIFFLIQSRALMPGRARTRVAKVRGTHANAGIQSGLVA